MFSYSVEGVGTPEAQAPAGLGKAFTAGARNVTDGYTVLATDLLVTVLDGGASAVINLPSVATRSSQLVVMNFGVANAILTPNAGDTINGQATLQLNSVTSPAYTSAILYPDGVSNAQWWAFAGHE